jgi:hypothetical protein
MWRRIARTLRGAIEEFFATGKAGDPAAWVRELACDEYLAAFGVREERLTELITKAAPGRGGGRRGKRNYEKLVSEYVHELHAAFYRERQIDYKPLTRAEMFGD